MSFRVTVKTNTGGEEFEIAKGCVKSVIFSSDIPQDSDARTKDVGSSITIKGKILTAVEDNLFDSTRGMAEWSVVPAEKADCYRTLEIEHIAAGVVVRKYTFPNAFVVDYIEDFGDKEGTGLFTLLVKQKKDKIANIKIEGGYPAGV